MYIEFEDDKVYQDVANALLDQFNLLHERSETCSIEQLAKLSDSMVSVARLFFLGA